MIRTTQKKLKINSIYYFALLVFAGVLNAQASKAESIGKTLASTWKSNPQLMAARQTYLSSGTDVQTAYADWLPNVSLELNYGSRSSRNTLEGGLRTSSTLTPWNARVRVNQNIFRGGTIIANVVSNKLSHAAAFGDLLATEQNVLLSAVRAYYGLLRDREVARFNRNNVSILRKRLSETRNRFQVGSGTRTQIAFAEARLSAAQTQLASAQAMVVASSTAFQRIVGRKPTGKLFFSKFPPVPRTLSQARAQARKNHPQLIAAEKRYRTASTAKVAAYGLFLPSVSVEGTYTQGQDLSTNVRDTTELSVTGRLSMPIFSGGRNFASVRRAGFEAERARFSLLDQTRQIDEAAVNAWQALKTARAQIASGRKQVNANRIALNGIRQQQSLGTSTFLDSLDAEQDYLNAQVALETAKQDEQVAVYSLLAAIGALTGKDLRLKGVK